ncbi:hypothetical protein PAL_GLEAN10023442 [Pteropus alecto]|uniref:Uncharacterized protein n=1 Tax=Pteropus alecto TaxID=9402 RepID=L5K1G3_PTEAL|nr:hypothetical protein PAL_GLEAN10023442 [Pteropus alecto]
MGQQPEDDGPTENSMGYGPTFPRPPPPARRKALGLRDSARRACQPPTSRGGGGRHVRATRAPTALALPLSPTGQRRRCGRLAEHRLLFLQLLPPPPSAPLPHSSSHSLGGVSASGLLERFRDGNLRSGGVRAPGGRGAGAAGPRGRGAGFPSRCPSARPEEAVAARGSAVSLLLPVRETRDRAKCRGDSEGAAARAGWGWGLL